MSRASNKEQILEAGLRVVHEKGFGATSVRDIVQAAGVPNGSFTNHFATKEAFGLEILDRYFSNSREVIERTLLDGDKPPLARLREYIELHKGCVGAYDMRNGCLFGNFSAEVVESESIRLRLVEIFAQLRAALAYCLKAAVAAGDVRPDTDPDLVANVILSSLQGAILLSKAEHDVAPIEQFETLLFSMILIFPRKNGRG
jgi:TetR/AcrR family transcriptional repressor of nem operon